MKISILTYGFSGWGGGIDFIRQILSFLDEIQESEMNMSKMLILPKDNVLGYLIKISYPYFNLLKQFLGKEKLLWKKKPGYSQEYLKNTFSDFNGNTAIILSGPSFNSQLKNAIQMDADIVFPCIDVPPDNFKLPWIGYIPDFQHHHLPQFFSKNEINIRNKAFSKMLNSAKHIVVNGREVIRDANRFYPGHSARLHALPFGPCPQKKWVFSTLDLREKYGITAQYFLISNQFWIHKDHKTAFRGFAKYCQEGGRADLVCTGEVLDYRVPGYIGELLAMLDSLGISKRVKILGHIPKIHQISLVKEALAVIQTTHFEGGPGGGSSYDAVSLGVPVIASNIPINLEMDCGDVTFYRVGDHDDLTSAMHYSHLKIKTKKSNNELWNEGLERRMVVANFLISVIKKAIK